MKNYNVTVKGPWFPKNLKKGCNSSLFLLKYMIQIRGQSTEWDSLRYYGLTGSENEERLPSEGGIRNDFHHCSVF